MDNFKKRIVIGKKNREIFNSDGPANLGFLDVLFEQINGQLYLINNEEFFCESKQVFVTGSYHEIDTKYEADELIQIEVIPTSQEWKPGDCRYVTTASKVEGNLSRKAVLQLIDANLPSPNDPTIYTDTLPSTPLIMIRDGSDVYGPFETDASIEADKSVLIKLGPLKGAFPGKFVSGCIRQYKYTDIESGIVQFEAKGETTSYIIRPEIYEKTTCEFKEYASDEEIIRIGSELLKKVNFKSFTKNQQMMLKASLTKAKDIPPNASDILQRFFNIASEAETKFDSIDTAIHEYLNSPTGQTLLSKHIDSREEQYLRKFKSEQEARLREELSSLQAEVKKLTKIKKDLESENQIASDEIEQQKFNLRDQQKIYIEEARSSESKELDAQIQAKKIELAALKEEIGPYKDLDQIKKEVSTAKQRLAVHNEDLTLAKNERHVLEDELKQRDEELRKKLIALRPYVETISGMIIPVEEAYKPLPYNVGREVARNDLLSERNKYIEDLRFSLSKRGRNYEKDFITNLLISIQQSFILILSGLPGVGKTSLVKILSESKRLSSRMLNISVGRGWTSQRDLLGYFNPLSNRVVPAPTGFYNYIQSCQHENGKTGIAAPLWVLLDEANLSAIEHYWAPFMGMADQESDRLLRISDSDTPLKIPDSLRFIGTINNDMTTEPLSPRLIDRAPIITLEPAYDTDDIDHDSLGESPDKSLPPFSHETLKQMFDIDQSLPLESERSAIAHQMALYHEVKGILMDSSISLGKRCVISKRKEKAIERYCLVAHPLMRSSSEMRALDYAISQHVLPLIQGNGDGYGSRLEKLLLLLNQSEFEISNRILQRIYETGKMDMNSFSYFS